MHSCFLVQAGIMISLDEPYIEEPESIEVLQFKHIIFPLVILGLGTSLAILVFLCEIWFRKIHKPIQVTVRYEEAFVKLMNRLNQRMWINISRKAQKIWIEENLILDIIQTIPTTISTEYDTSLLKSLILAIKLSLFLCMF